MSDVPQFRIVNNPDLPDRFESIAKIHRLEPAWSLEQLLEADLNEEFLVDQVLVENQPMVVAGEFKSLKTTMLIMLALGLASRAQSLGRYEVIKRKRVLFCSAESGKKKIRNTIYAVAKQMGINLAELRDSGFLKLSWWVPKISSMEVMEYFKNEIDKAKAEVVMLPTVRELNRRGWTTKRWVTKKGDRRGGRVFTRNALYKLLTNVTYIGKIKYKDETHVGEHTAIVPVEVFNRVQTNLKRNGQSGGTMVRNKHSALLKGLLHCKSCGRVMTHSFSCKGNKRYRYYVCGTAMQRGWSECPAPSVPAGEIERFVVEQIRTIGKDPALLKQTTIDVQQRNHVEFKRLRDEQKSLSRQMRDDHTKLQAIVANPNIASNLSGLSEIQSRLETADRHSQQITSELAVLEAQRIDDQQITNVLTGFDGLWQALPPKEQVRLVRLLIESVSFDGPGGNVAITFHPTGLKSLTETQLEHAQ